MSRYRNGNNLYYRGDYYYIAEPEIQTSTEIMIDMSVSMTGSATGMTGSNDSKTGMTGSNDSKTGMPGEKCAANCEQCSSKEMKISKKNPLYWGPRYWFTLHNGANNYPLKPTIDQQEMMKGYIMGIPVTLPCAKCQKHAEEFIGQNFTSLNNICSSRQSLFNFFVDMHNNVNKINGKPILTYQQAMELYK